MAPLECREIPQVIHGAVAGMTEHRKAPTDRPSGPGSDRRVLDLAHLDHHTFGDAGLRAELLELFTGQLGQYLNALETSSSHQDWLVAAHTLKGSARAVGAIAISEICQTLEDLPREHWLQVRDEPMAELQSAAEECRRLIVKIAV